MRFDKILGIHAQSLQLHAKRAEVLAGNIANADTPGYKARDFDFSEVLQQQTAQQSKLRTTHQSHIPLDNGIISPSEMAYRIPSQPSLDGNTVDSQLEHTAYAENAIQYQTSLRFLSGTIQTLRKAITGQ
ncbi:flagellar basal body rod protein FlgB [Sedimenticola selenatireducens]|uniref:Flagellar basal body rod protein FlgB n=1 Tax=Sedimenticola selenatireducens TaxID=191960 RepID=A0A2N6CRR4_9GAMM|nr:flagellar basal body rod protein FlgB [Sedimenticola selenatireducens]PLX59782.1 MAG: flagellar basal body rod protein FlgB [Sedimenticola selenatireducens]